MSFILIVSFDLSRSMVIKKAVTPNYIWITAF